MGILLTNLYQHYTNMQSQRPISISIIDESMQVAIIHVAIMTVYCLLCLYVRAHLLMPHKGRRLYGYH